MILISHGGINTQVGLSYLPVLLLSYYFHEVGQSILSLCFKKKMSIVRINR